MGAFPNLVIGGLLVVIALGLIARSRFAWWMAVIGLALSIAVHLFGPVPDDAALVILRALMLVVLLLNHRRFTRRRTLVQGAFGVYIVAMFILCASTLTLQRGSQFNPPIEDPITALYFVVVTISSVGYGDITPRDADARGFVLVLLALGLVIVGTAISTFLIPLLTNRLQGILWRQEDRVHRSKHFVIIGTSPLARNAAAELEKRGQEVTLVLARASDDPFYAKRDVVVGDPAELEILRDAGVTRARGVLALTTDDSTNGFVVLGVNELDPEIPTVAALNDPTNQSRLERTQPSMLLSLQVLGGQLLAMALTGERVDQELLNQALRIHAGASPIAEG